MKNLKIDIEKATLGTIMVWVQGGSEGSSLVGEYQTIDEAVKVIKKLWLVE